MTDDYRLRDLPRAVPMLDEMARHLPEPRAQQMRELVAEIQRGEHRTAVQAMLRPSQFRQARELVRQR